LNKKQEKNNALERQGCKIIVLAMIMFIGFLAVLPMISAEIEYKVSLGKEFDIKRPCFNNGTYCSAAAECNLTIIYPNGTAMIDNQLMSNMGSYHNYTISSELNNKLGILLGTQACNDAGVTGSGTFEAEVSPSGKSFSAGEGIAGLGIIAVALVLAFFFMFLGFKLSENERLFPLTLLFLLISFAFVIYSLHLSYAYTVDVFQYGSLGNVSSVIYTSILWLLIGVGLISTILILMSSIRELGRAAKQREYGEGFNPITNSYDF